MATHDGGLLSNTGASPPSVLHLVSKMQKLGDRNAANKPRSRRAINSGRSLAEPLGDSESTAADQASYRARAHSVDERVKPANQLAGTARRKDQATVVLKGNASTPREPLKRTVRRHQLRQMVPLADTTIYEMEQRGKFPRRFYLTPRCVAWDVAEIESWIEERRRASGAHLIERAPSPDVRNAHVDRSGARFRRNQMHGRRIERRRMLAPINPSIDDICPFLEHVTTLLFVFGLVVNAA